LHPRLLELIVLTIVAGIVVLVLARHLWRTRNSRWIDIHRLRPLRDIGRVGEYTFKTLPPLALLLAGLALLASGVLQLL